MPEHNPHDAEPARSAPPVREWRCVGCGKTFESRPDKAMPERCVRCDGNVFEADGLFM